MKKVEVLRISYYPPNKGYAVILKETDGERQIPIIVGSNEAQAIAMAIEGIEMPRPLTHDLMLDIIHSVDVDIKHIEISDIREGTFFAKIVMTTVSYGDVSIDSRPSDAIALALRSMAPIYLHEVIFNSVDFFEKPQKTENVEEVEDSSFETTKFLEPITNSEDMIDNLNEALERAVEEEEYEVAARLRDRIKEIEKKSNN